MIVRQCIDNSSTFKACTEAQHTNHRYGQQEDSGKKAGPGLLIGCMVDVSSGLLSFTVNGQEAANKFQVRVWWRVKAMRVMYW